MRSRQTRADQIARLLVETELPVTQIAEATGFEDVRHVARYFRIVRGMTRWFTVEPSCADVVRKMAICFRKVALPDVNGGLSSSLSPPA